MKRTFAQLAMVLMLIAISPSPALQAQDNVRKSANTIELNGHRYILHKVNKGETIYSISRAYNLPSIEIMTTNNLTRDNIKRSQTLLIPINEKTTAPKSAITGAESQTAIKNQTPIKSEAPQKSAVATPPPAKEPTPQPTTKPIEEQNLIAQKLEEAQEPEGQPDTTTPQTVVGGVAVREFIPGDPLNVVVFLPLSGTATRNDQNFIDYYKGTLIGLGRLKRSGISVNVKFVSSNQSTTLLADQSTGNPLASANLIIGPVYPEQFANVAAYAATHGVPIVNPLGSVGDVSSPYIFEAAPSEETKYDKVLAMMNNPNVNAIVIDHIEWNDTALEKFIDTNIKGDNISMIPYNSARTKTREMDALLAAALDKTRENVIFVPVSRDNAVEEILSRISSINTLNQYNITVIGTSAWGWFNNINLDMYFRLKVHYPTSYHADRANASVAAFYKEYLASFGTLPTPYSFRGNDVIRYFAGAMNRFGTNMPQKIKGYNPEILQVQYNFVQTDPNSKHENQNWTLVSYNPDYTVRIK